MENDLRLTQNDLGSAKTIWDGFKLQNIGNGILNRREAMERFKADTKQFAIGPKRFGMDLQSFGVQHVSDDLGRLENVLGK